MKLDFTGKTIIVTGGSRGIGASISLEFAAAGANVMIDCLPIEQDLEGLKEVEVVMKKNDWKHDSYTGDITSPKEMDELVNRALSRFGSVDVLINSAGFTKPSSTENLSLDLWKKGIEVNLTGAFVVSQAVLKHMAPAGKGRIIYIGSAGSISGGGGGAFYPAAKAGINGLVRILSKEYAPKGITVNAVLPALIETDLLKDREPDPVKRKEFIRRIPVGRFGQPEDVAYLTLFLSSDFASFITGQHIVIDGGSTYK